MRTAAKTLVLFAVSLVVALGVGELVVRVFSPQQLIVYHPELWQPDEGLGWVHRPDVLAEVNTGDGPATIRFDAEGYRVGTDPVAAPTRDVLLLGDSFMEAIQVDHEQTLAGLLESELGRELGAPVRVWNAGTAGWSPSHYLIQARRSLAQRRYDAVVVGVYVGNDAESKRRSHFPPRERADRHRFHWPERFDRRGIVRAWFLPLNQWLEARSHLAVLLKNSQQALLMRLGLSAAYFPVELVPSPELERAWNVSADVLRDLVQLARAEGAAPFVFLIPSRYQVDDAVLAQYMAVYGFERRQVDLELPNRLASRALARRGVTALDMLPALRAAWAAGAAPYGAVDTHFSADGHAAVAERLTPELARALRAR